MTKHNQTEKECPGFDGVSLRPENVKVGHLDIHYLTGGEGEPLIVIHGGGDSGHAWLQNVIELSKYYQVYLPDLPGFGH
ncbi:MAG: alpha/beta fold hydrolase, partial [Dehalococcoidales bacterium]